MAKLGILVVGQSPRPEIEAEFARLLPGVALDLRGCLDGLGPEALAALAPGPVEETLFTRLPSGAGITLGKAAVVRHGTARLAALEASGADAVVVLCTGDFPDWSGRRVLFPSSVLRHAVQGLQAAGRLGVLVPLEAQIAEAHRRWGALGYAVTAAALSPNAEAEAATAAGRALAASDPDLLVFDCVSYLRATKRAVTSAAGCPGVLAISAIARMVAELLDPG